MDRQLNHSIENIYSNVGQYDHRYVVFYFYYNSESYKEFGNSVHGLLIYTPSERAILEEAIQPGNNSNNDGMVKLDSNLKEKALHNKLVRVGFPASDVSSMSTVDSTPPVKTYGSKEIKKIPNTITIEYKVSKGDPYNLDLMNLEHRVRDGLPLLPNEQRKLIALQLLQKPDKERLGPVRSVLTNPATNIFYDDVLLLMNSYYYNIYDSGDKSVKLVLNKLLSKRKSERTKFILAHLGISERHLKSLETNNPLAWKQLLGHILYFEPEVIDIWGWKHPVWWDFERFIHIYLRHYKEFFIEKSNKGQGTTFVYNFKDIRRVICNVLKANKEEIEASLANGKVFRKYDDHGYRYNGNYYTFSIDKDGRLMQFHPQEIKTTK